MCLKKTNQLVIYEGLAKNGPYMFSLFKWAILATNSNPVFYNSTRFNPHIDEEFEDSEGNVVNRKTYDDMRRQGIL